MGFQPIYDIAELCYRKGISQAVLCPGSRSAPLTLAFSRHPKITCRTFHDERSAGFIALGIAQASGRATALICTSGTAALNFGPAIAEAFYQHIPLVVFTADRPPEWIDQLDGQAIRQQYLYGPHVKRSFTLPSDYVHPDATWAVNRIVNEAINIANDAPWGPVHINCPFREPLYPTSSEKVKYSSVRVIEKAPSERTLEGNVQKKLTSTLFQSKRTLVVVGQHSLAEIPLPSLRKLQKCAIPILGEVHSNTHSLAGIIDKTDLFLGSIPEKTKSVLRPDLLITFGNSLLTRNLKTFLRQYPAADHWHISEDPVIADPLKNLTQHIQTSPGRFFEFMANALVDRTTSSQQKQYSNAWTRINAKAGELITGYLKQQSFDELDFVRDLLHSLPHGTRLHLASSMAIRYANLIGVHPSGDIEVFANRGTSGIDGCSSTAVGHALASVKPTVLLTGDVGFFYDRNAFWHSYPITNFAAAVINNHGGAIFRLIDGPGNLPETDEYFVGAQPLGARPLCQEHGLGYVAYKRGALGRSSVVQKGKATIIELETDSKKTRRDFDRLKNFLKKHYEAH